MAIPDSGLRLRLAHASTAPIAFLGLAVLFQSQDYVSLFTPGVDIPVGIGGLLQWIASIDDRFYSFRLDKRSETNQILFRAACVLCCCFLGARDQTPRRSKLF